MKIPDYLPENPGVYLFLDKEGNPIYIGKAKNLKKRIKQYFRKDTGLKGSTIIRKAVEVKYIITDSEIEALLLEDTLIKKHKPRYNINLKDDKKYPYIKVSTEEEFPRVFLTRKIVKGKGVYFGPYTSAKSVRRTLRLLQKLFPLRTCRYKKLPDKECLDYHIGRCPAPCTGRISREKYNENVQKVISFLKGRTEELEKELEREMWRASEGQEFEKAAVLRDRLFALRNLKSSQNVIFPDKRDLDIINIAGDRGFWIIAVLQIRMGRMFGKETFAINDPLQEGEASVLEYFLIRYYRELDFIPPVVYVPEEFEGMKRVEKALGVTLKKPVRGKEKRLLLMAKKNAGVELEGYRLKVKRSIPGSLLELQRHLKLKNPPKRIEGFDISNISGRYAVGSCVVFVNGRPLKGEYRRFRIKSIKGIDDYRMMGEVISRRILRILKEGKQPPDLILVDGGKGQLNVAMSVVESLGLEGYNVLAIAKRFETLYLPNGSVLQLPPDSPALHLLKHVRDEAHRFAVGYHRRLRGKKVKSSVLDTIPGIGEKRKRDLILYFGSEKRIEGASIYDLMKVKGIGPLLAKTIYEKFHKIY
ncbi:excinuclease ABC subunit UvrC [candidate division WOR-3 bacterium]|nr:excinuclease ABC subunit UvrC [candidate division WOR-3 bacterium]